MTIKSAFIDKKLVMKYIIHYNVRSIFIDDIVLDFTKKRYKIFKWKKKHKLGKFWEMEDLLPEQFNVSYLKGEK